MRRIRGSEKDIIDFCKANFFLTILEIIWVTFGLIMLYLLAK